MTIKKRTAWITGVIAIVALVLGGWGVSAAWAAAQANANCTSAPAITQDASGQHITIDCVLPNPDATTVTAPPVTETTTATVTSTVTDTATVTNTQTVTQPPVTNTQTVTSTVTQPPVTNTVTVTQSPTSTTTTTPSSTTTTTTPPPTGTCPVAGANKPGASDGRGGCFPGPGNVGVPKGTVLTVINGDYIVSTANAKVDALDIRGSLRIRAAGVTVTRSKVASSIIGEAGYGSFTVTDSELHASSLDYKVFWGADDHFTALRNEISGGQSGGDCSDCFLKDNWIHNPTVLPTNSTAHMSAFRMSQRSTFIHNTIACEVKQSAADGGCSAGLTGYGDFEAVINNTIDGNLFASMPYASFCAYGGASNGKPYSGQDHDIKFTNNVFQKGTTGKCAVYDAVGDYNASKPGNVPGWASNATAAQKDAAIVSSNNKWDDGTYLKYTDFS